MAGLDNILQELDEKLKEKYGPVGESAKKKKKKRSPEEENRRMRGLMNQNQRRLLEQIEGER